MQKLLEAFNEKINNLYADRDIYSRAKIIELAKDYLSELAKDYGWVNVSDRLPVKHKKYVVKIDTNNGIRESYCSYFPKKKKFHFDMRNINWRVIAWLDVPEY